MTSLTLMTLLKAWSPNTVIVGLRLQHMIWVGGCVHAKSFQSCPTLCDPMDYIACQAPLSVGFSRQEYWNGLPFPTPGDPPDSGIGPVSLISFALAGIIFTTNATWEAPRWVGGGDSSVHNSRECLQFCSCFCSISKVCVCVCMCVCVIPTTLQSSKARLCLKSLFLAAVLIAPQPSTSGPNTGGTE